MSGDELIQASPLVRFGHVTLMTVGAIKAAGLTVRPTGRNPLHYSIDFEELNSGVESLVHCQHRTIDNPYLEP